MTENINTSDLANEERVLVYDPNNKPFTVLKSDLDKVLAEGYTVATQDQKMYLYKEKLLKDEEDKRQKPAIKEEITGLNFKSAMDTVDNYFGGDNSEKLERLKDPNKVFYIDPDDGGLIGVDKKYEQEWDEHYQKATTEERQARFDQLREEDLYTGVLPTIAATQASVARGFTLGASDAASAVIEKVMPEKAPEWLKVIPGSYSPETLRKLKEHNSEISIVGEIVGAVAPILVSGGALAAKGAIKGAAEVGAELGTKVGIPSAIKAAAGTAEAGVKLSAPTAMLNEATIKLGNTIFKALTKETSGAAAKIAVKALGRGVGGALEGAVYGLGQGISEESLKEQSGINGTALLAHTGMGALLGGTFGGMFGAGEVILPEVGRALKFGKVTEGYQSILENIRNAGNNFMSSKNRSIYRELSEKNGIKASEIEQIWGPLNKYDKTGKLISGYKDEVLEKAMSGIDKKSINKIKQNLSFMKDEEKDILLNSYKKDLSFTFDKANELINAVVDSVKKSSFDGWNDYAPRIEEIYGSGFAKRLSKIYFARDKFRAAFAYEKFNKFTVNGDKVDKFFKNPKKFTSAGSDEYEAFVSLSEATNDIHKLSLDVKSGKGGTFELIKQHTAESADDLIVKRKNIEKKIVEAEGKIKEAELELKNHQDAIDKKINEINNNNSIPQKIKQSKINEVIESTKYETNILETNLLKVKSKYNIKEGRAIVNDLRNKQKIEDEYYKKIESVEKQFKKIKEESTNFDVDNLKVKQDLLTRRVLFEHKKSFMGDMGLNVRDLIIPGAIGFSSGGLGLPIAAFSLLKTFSFVTKNPASAAYIWNHGTMAAQNLFGSYIPKAVGGLLKPLSNKALLSGTIKTTVAIEYTPSWTKFIDKYRHAPQTPGAIEAWKDSKLAGIQEEIIALANNPQILESRLNESFKLSDEFIPYITQPMKEKISVAVSFLKDKAINLSPINPLYPNRKRKPSNAELKEFEKYLSYTFEPANILKDFKNGIVNNQAIEVLKEVYPEIMEQIVLEITERLMDPKLKLDSKAKANLKKIMGIGNNNTMQFQEVFNAEAEKPADGNGPKGTKRAVSNKSIDNIKSSQSTGAQHIAYK